MQKANKENTNMINNVLEPTFSYINKRLKCLEEVIIKINSKIDQIFPNLQKTEQYIGNHENRINKIIENIKVLKNSQTVVIKNISSIIGKLLEFGKNKTESRKDDIIFSERNIIKDRFSLRQKNEVDIPTLTYTEIKVLRVLSNSGPKTALEIKDIIGKTREHSARLMKKLYSQGYVLRETRIIPYTYKINETIKESLQFTPSDEVNYDK